MKKRIRRNADDRLQRLWKLLQKTPRDIETVRRYLAELVRSQGERQEPHEEPRARTAEERLEQAVERFRDRRFSVVLTSLIKPALDNQVRGEHGGDDLEADMPARGAVWIVNGHEDDVRPLMRELRPDPPTTLEQAGALIRRFDLDMTDDLDRLVTIAVDEGDSEEFQEEERTFLQEVARRSERAFDDSDEYPLSVSGWHAVGNTGFYAVEIDGEIILGLDVGGDELRDNWTPLYHACGLTWHTD